MAALLCAGAALAPQDAWAASPKTKSLDFSESNGQAVKGRFYSEDGNAIAIDRPTGDGSFTMEQEWATYGWRFDWSNKDLANQEALESGADSLYRGNVVLTLKDFAFTGSANNAINLPQQIDTAGNEKNTYIALFSDSTIDLTGVSADDAALLLDGVAICKSTLPGAQDNPTLTIKVGDHGMGILAASKGLAIDGAWGAVAVKVDAPDGAIKAEGDIEIASATVTANGRDASGADLATALSSDKSISISNSAVTANGKGGIGANLSFDILDSDIAIASTGDGDGLAANISATDGERLYVEKSTVNVSAEGRAGYAGNYATFVESEAAFTSGGDTGFFCEGTFSLGTESPERLGGTFAAESSAAQGGIGLNVAHVRNDPAIAPALHINGDLNASGSMAGVLIMREGEWPVATSPVTFGKDVMPQQDGVVAGVVADVLDQRVRATKKATSWSFSEGAIAYENGAVAGALPAVGFLVPKACFLEVDGQVMVNADNPADVADAEIPGKAAFTAADRTLTLLGTADEDTADQNPLNGVVAKGMALGNGTPLTIAFTDIASVGTAASTAAENAALTSDGPLRFAGGEGNKLKLKGRVITNPDTAKNLPGSITSESGTVTVVGLKGENGAAVETHGLQGDAHLKLQGGTFTVVALDKLNAVQVDGDLEATGDGNAYQLMSIFAEGVMVHGTFTQRDVTFLAMGLGGTGMEVDNGNNESIAAQLESGQATILGLVTQQEPQTHAQNDAPCYGMVARNGNVNISGGSHQMVSALGNADSAGLYVQGGNLNATAGSLTAAGAMGANGIKVDSGDGMPDAGELFVDGGWVEGIGTIGALTDKTTVRTGTLNALSFPLVDGVIPTLNASSLNQLRSELSESGESGALAAVDKATSNKLVVERTEGSHALVTAREESALPVNGNKNLAASATTRIGLQAQDAIDIQGGVVNAFAFPKGLFGSSAGKPGEASYGMSSGSEVNVSGGIVCALADVSSSNQTTAMGIYAGTNTEGQLTYGTVNLTGGTTTAYAFQTAQRRASIFAEDSDSGTQNIGPNMKVAAGVRAPGGQVETSTVLAAYSYAYVTDAALYLTNDFDKWDYFDQAALFVASAFDPPNGENKVSKEMMASLVGLGRSLVVLSDNADFSQDTFFSSYMYAYMQSQMQDPNTLYHSPLLKGTGLALLFENGQLFNYQDTLQMVDGVEVFDFGSRYNTQPELDGMRALMPTGKELIHSVHFYYEGELPASATVIMAVGEDYKNEPVTWGYSDNAFTKLTTIVDQNVDPYGWLEVAGQPALHHETAIYHNGKGPGPEPTPTPIPSTGDPMAPVMWALAAAVLTSGGVIAYQVRKRKS